MSKLSPILGSFIVGITGNNGNVNIIHLVQDDSRFKIWYRYDTGNLQGKMFRTDISIFEDQFGINLSNEPDFVKLVEKYNKPKFATDAVHMRSGYQFSVVTTGKNTNWININNSNLYSDDDPRSDIPREYCIPITSDDELRKLALIMLNVVNNR